MKQPNLSHSLFSGSPVLTSKMHTAHSGPELVTEVPHSQLASEIAQALLTDYTQLTQDLSTLTIGSGFSMSYMIGLARQ